MSVLLLQEATQPATGRYCLPAGGWGLADERRRRREWARPAKSKELPPCRRHHARQAGAALGYAWSGAPRGREPGHRLCPEPPPRGATAPVLVPPRSPARRRPGEPGLSGRPGRGADWRPGRGRGGGRGRSHRRLSALLVLVSLLCALAGRGGGRRVARRGRQGGPPRTPSTSLRGSTEQVLESLLATGATAQAVVQNAIDGACRTTTPQSSARAEADSEIGRAVLSTAGPGRRAGGPGAAFPRCRAAPGCPPTCWGPPVPRLGRLRLMGTGWRTFSHGLLQRSYERPPLPGGDRRRPHRRPPRGAATGKSASETLVRACTGKSFRGNGPSSG